MNKCPGCGAILQTEDSSKEGYVSNLSNKLCERCFRIKNYNDYKFLIKDNQEYIDILKDIGKTNDLVVLVVDLFNISKNLLELKDYMSNKVLLVLTKRDILPKSCYDENLKKYFDDYNLNIVDKVIISSFKNYNFDELFNKINKYKTSNQVYVIGYTNSGKSTMINKILKNYSTNSLDITTSSLPSTTINNIEVVVDDTLTLIDTPGLLDSEDIINYIDTRLIKKIVPKAEIRPITYQIKDSQTILLEDIVRLDIHDTTNITLYMSNNINLKRVYKDVNDLKSLNKIDIFVEKDHDLVIQGLGFIKFAKSANVTLYLNGGIAAFTRKNLI